MLKTILRFVWSILKKIVDKVLGKDAAEPLEAAKDELKDALERSVKEEEVRKQ